MAEIVPKRIIKGKDVMTARRECGHPFYPTFDCFGNEGCMITSYCLYCIIERLGIEPCAKATVKQPQDWQDPSKINWVFNK